MKEREILSTTQLRIEVKEVATDPPKRKAAKSRSLDRTTLWRSKQFAQTRDIVLEVHVDRNEFKDIPN